MNPESRVQSASAFSLAERDRRWGAVRELMELASLDLLVVPTEADSRYLTQASYDIGPTILPLVGDVTLLSDEGRVSAPAQSWIGDVRPVGRRWAEGIIARLSELNANGKIIGVMGLDGSAAYPDGDWNYNTFIWMREAFPRTRWVGATILLQQVRSIKSDEEIAVLELAAAATDAGLLAATNELRPGTTDHELWGQMVLAAVRAGADPPRRSLLGAAPINAGRPPALPTGRVIQAGDLLAAELAASWSGYEAPGAQMALLGPLPDEWKDAWQVHQGAWHAAWETLRPGTSVADAADAAQTATTGSFHVRLEVHGVGLGGDQPCFPPGINERNRPAPVILQEGMVLALEPAVEWVNAHGPQHLSWRDPILITDAGPRRLGTRPHEIAVR